MNREVKDCVYNWASDRKTVKFTTANAVESVTAHEVINMNIVDTQMYIDGYQVKLVSDTSYGSLWEISFTLKEF